MTVGNGARQDKQTQAVRRVGRRLLKRTLTTLPVLWLVVTVVFRCLLEPLTFLHVSLFFTITSKVFFFSPL